MSAAGDLGPLSKRLGTSNQYDNDTEDLKLYDVVCRLHTKTMHYMILAP